MGGGDFGPIIYHGCIITLSKDSPGMFDISGGEYYIGGEEFVVMAERSIEMSIISNGCYIGKTKKIIKSIYSRCGNSERALVNGEWARHSIYVYHSHGEAKYALILGSSITHSNIRAQGLSDPIPNIIQNSCFTNLCPLFSVLITTSDLHGCSLRDIRPTISFQPDSSTAHTRIHTHACLSTCQNPEHGVLDSKGNKDEPREQFISLASTDMANVANYFQKQKQKESENIANNESSTIKIKIVANSHASTDQQRGPGSPDGPYSKGRIIFLDEIEVNVSSVIKFKKEFVPGIIFTVGPVNDTLPLSLPSDNKDSKKGGLFLIPVGTRYVLYNPIPGANIIYRTQEPQHFYFDIDTEIIIPSGTKVSFTGFGANAPIMEVTTNQDNKVSLA